MTDEQAVKAIYPTAWIRFDDEPPFLPFRVWREEPRSSFAELLGEGNSPAEAWADARKCLPTQPECWCEPLDGSLHPDCPMHSYVYKPNPAGFELEPCFITIEETSGKFTCTRGLGHEGPCAAVPVTEEQIAQTKAAAYKGIEQFKRKQASEPAQPDPVVISEDESAANALAADGLRRDYPLIWESVTADNWANDDLARAWGALVAERKKAAQPDPKDARIAKLEDIRRNIFELCESTEDNVSTDTDFGRGQVFEAKHIRNALGDYMRGVIDAALQERR